MARKKDAEEDFASKAILDQLQTKTVGAPPSTTGLTGDQLPNTIFNVDTFDQVRNQVTLQLSNLELLNVLNTIGQVTNTQSQSGPIPKTGKIVKTNFTAASQNKVVATAQPGEVFQVMGACANNVSGSGTFTFVLSFTDGTDSVRIESLTGSGYNEFNITSTAGPMFIDENISLEVDSSGGSFPTNVDILVALQRVR